MSFRESEFIAWATATATSLPVGPGDDAAVLADGTVICVDAVVEGVHFDPGTPLARVAHKALAACVSDVCAMGATPQTVLVAAQLPPGLDGETLARALADRARALDVTLAGGDTVATAPGALALAVTATGRCTQDGAPWLRSGGRPGDLLVVSGPLGGARSGRHLDVRPRADVVAALRNRGVVVHAALDLSDGLGRDLPRLCGASGVGAVVQAGALPVHDDVAPGRDPVAAALGDGEDFELLLALPEAGPRPGSGPLATPPLDGLVQIGRLVDGEAPVLHRGGTHQPWPTSGYEHEF